MDQEKLAELIDAISADPEKIAELSREELDAVRAELVATGRSLAEGVKAGTSEDKTADLAAAQEARERVTIIDERLAVFVEEDKAAEEKADEVLAALDFPEPEVTVEGPEEEEEEGEDEEASVEEVVVAEEVKEPALVASKPSIGALAARAPKLPSPSKALVASAGPALHSNHPRGFDSPTELATAMMKQWSGYGSGKINDQALSATFNTLDNYKYQVKGDVEHDARVIDEMLREVKTSGALVASGGFCAPAEPVYEFFSISDRDGMIQLPTVGAPRGQLVYPVSSSFADIQATAAWNAALGNQHTNAEDIAATTKPTYAVACPTTTTCAVAAYTNILQFGNFAQRFYPESVAHAIAESMTFSAHKVNGTLIGLMVSASTAHNGGDTGGGGLVNVANIINFEAMKYRDEYRMSPSARLTLVSPAWVRDALVADLIARQSTTDMGNARARVVAVFESILVDVQWVQDWQSPADGVPSADDNGWRTAADFMLFAPGTFVRMDQGTLDLGIVRDSTLNATNDFQIFTESFEGICEVGHDSWLIDDVTICPRGITAGTATLRCNPGQGS